MLVIIVHKIDYRTNEPEEWAVEFVNNAIYTSFITTSALDEGDNVIEQSNFE